MIKCYKKAYNKLKIRHFLNLYCFSKNSKCGVILIEVLLTIVILSTVLTMVVEGILNSYRAMIYSSTYNNATALIDELVFDVYKEIRLGTDVRYMQGEKELFEEDFDFSIKIKDLRIGNILEWDREESDLKTVKAAISWKTGSQDKEYSLEFFAFDWLSNKN